MREKVLRSDLHGVCTLAQQIRQCEIGASPNPSPTEVLVVLDDISLLPVAAVAAGGLYRLVDTSLEKRSVAISSNLRPSSVDELMPKTLATAAVDRLHPPRSEISGDSVRLIQRLAGQGVKPLS